MNLQKQNRQNQILNGWNMTTEILDFQAYREQKDNVLRLSLGYNTEIWEAMKEAGYDVRSSAERDQFFKDLEDLD